MTRIPTVGDVVTFKPGARPYAANKGTPFTVTAVSMDNTTTTPRVVLWLSDGDGGTRSAYADDVTSHDIATMAQAYIVAALWSSTDEEGEPLDAVYGPDDVSPDLIQSSTDDVRSFVIMVTGEEIGADISTLDAAQFGHDLWLTRNHHGAGFWDRGLGELGDVLTKWAHSLGGVDLYVTDDGLIDAM